MFSSSPFVGLGLSYRPGYDLAVSTLKLQRCFCDIMLCSEAMSLGLEALNSALSCAEARCWKAATAHVQNICKMVGCLDFLGETYA